jgi:heme/copper-type cytochrome/quinol oxidase subunit 2
MKRRQIGPAYERSPADKMSEWTNRNTLVLISSIVAAVIIWFIIGWVVDDFVNFLATDGDETVEKPYSSNAPAVIAFKLVACLGSIFIILKTRTK